MNLNGGMDVQLQWIWTAEWRRSGTRLKEENDIAAAPPKRTCRAGSQTKSESQADSGAVCAPGHKTDFRTNAQAYQRRN